MAKLNESGRKARANSTAAKRKAKREELFPGSGLEIFDMSTTETVGYARIPRVLPLVAALINTLGDKVNAGPLYQVLWAYDFGQGFVEVKNQLNMLFEAGYNVSLYRAERTWNERIEVLVKHGFVKTAPSGLVAHGYILLRDPHRAVLDLYRTGKRTGKEADVWLTVFRQRCIDIGVDLTKLVPLPTMDFSGPEFDYLREGADKALDEKF